MYSVTQAEIAQPGHGEVAPNKWLVIIYSCLLCTTTAFPASVGRAITEPVMGLIHRDVEVHGFEVCYGAEGGNLELCYGFSEPCHHRTDHTVRARRHMSYQSVLQGVVLLGSAWCKHLVSLVQCYVNT